jgi:hypothetical protein
MATLTFEHSSFAGGIVRVEFDVNDANWRVSRVRCTNNSNLSAAAAILDSGVEAFTAVAPPNATTSWNVTGIQLGWDSVNGGIMMGNYVVQVKYPAAA